MNKDYLVWSDGSKVDHKDSFLRQKNFEILQEFSNKRNIDNVYVKDDCVLYLVNGELFKEGLFKWEKTETNFNKFTYKRERKLVSLKSNNMNVNEMIIDLSIGENHILIQTAQGRVYSWGDNYYGQLGLGNCMMPKVLEPQLVKFHSSEIRKVFAYKDNSFAIDSNKKLWVWGKNDFLASNFKGNLFKPLQILTSYNIESLKINDDRIIAAVTNASMREIRNTPEDDDEEENEMIDFKERQKEREKTEKLEKLKLAEKKEDKKNEKSEKMNSLLMSSVKRLNDDTNDIISKLTEDDKILGDIRRKVLSDQTAIKKVGLDNIWESIEVILSHTQKINKQRDSRESLTIKDTIDVFSTVLNSMLTGTFSQLKVNQIVENFSSYEKEVSKLIVNIKSDELVKDDSVVKLFENTQILLGYFLKYKKLEMLIHKMSAHQFLLKSFRFENVLEALELILEQDDNIERKLYLIEKSFDNLRFLLEKTNTSFQNLENIYGNLHKINLISENTNAEKFLHKHIIESTFYVRDLWKLLINHVEAERKAKEKEAQLFRVLDQYKQLYSIQMYLNSISIKNIFFDDKKKKILKKKIDLDIITIKNKIALMLTEIDGAITRLESILNEKLDKSKTKTDIFSNELIVMYATSLLDNAYLKKMLFTLTVKLFFYL